MNNKELKKFRKRGKLATRKWRLKLSTALQASDNPETPKTSHYSDMYPYKTPASFGKARRKVQCALPKSPRKRTAVLANLAQGLQVKFVKKVASNALNAAVKTAVIEFYNNDTVSRMMPGKADFVNVITDADTFSKAVEMVATDSVSVTVMSQADIDKRCSDLEELWRSMSVMPGVFKIDN